MTLMWCHRSVALIFTQVGMKFDLIFDGQLNFQAVFS